MPGQSEENDDVVDETNGEASPASGDEPAAPRDATDPLGEARAEAARMKDQWMRTAADFDNFRKRARRELEDTRKAGKEDLLKEFLPVFDNLERAIQSAQRATEVKAVAEGLQMVLRQYIDTLARGGITKVPGVGAQFDPTHHEAIQQVETDEQPAGTVVAEVQPGYMQGDRLIRAAMVVVAKPKSDATGGEGSASE
ncbi:MAG: nucleotide exchange factor GrpE [Labilithrix sp.]|nr:nucleotide exchange factor GrpE [Labilithrix sp.]